MLAKVNTQYLLLLFYRKHTYIKVISFLRDQQRAQVAKSEPTLVRAHFTYPSESRVTISNIYMLYYAFLYILFIVCI